MVKLRSRRESVVSTAGERRNGKGGRREKGNDGGEVTTVMRPSVHLAPTPFTVTAPPASGQRGKIPALPR